MKTRNGFVRMVNTELRADNEPVYKDVREDTVGLAEKMGYRRWDARAGFSPAEAKGFDPEAARLAEERRLAREAADFAKLQARIDTMIDLGLKPDISVLRTLSDKEFSDQLAEIQANASEVVQEDAPVKIKAKPGPKKSGE